MLPGHLLGTLLVAAAWDRVRPLGPRGWRLAILFGVVIDVDHALELPAYLAAHGLAGVDPVTMLHHGNAWRGFMHEPVLAAPVVIVACALARSGVPAGFWLLHMVQDFVIGKRIGWGSPAEWALTAALLALTTLVFTLEHRKAGQGTAFWRHVGARVGLLRAARVTTA